MSQLYIKLRGVMFAEDGFALDVPAVHKDDHAVFRRRFKPGGAFACDVADELEGCTGKSGRTVAIDLAEYPDPDRARQALLLMCANLGGALDGGKRAREGLALGLKAMLYLGLKIDVQDGAKQVGILQRLFGPARVLAEMKQLGTEEFLVDPDFVSMLDDALPAHA